MDEVLGGVLEEGEIGEGKLNADAIRLILAQQTHVLPVTDIAVAEVALTIFDELLGGNTTGVTQWTRPAFTICWRMTSAKIFCPCWPLSSGRR